MTMLSPLLLVLACQTSQDQVQLSRLAPHGGGVGGVTVAIRRADGAVEGGDLDVTVQTRLGEGDWAAAEVSLAGAEDHLEVVLVADNSGSEEGYLEPMQEGVRAFGHHLLELGDEERVGLVRVSTVASAALGLTDDAEAWDLAVDELFIANGWTALWDGVRLGNEVLADGSQVQAGGGLEVCLTQPRRGVVVFTDGQENNSADEHDTRYDGDGIDTTVEELLDLSVLGVPTPIYAVGIGDEVDHDQLALLAAGSGGAWREIAAVDELASALTETVDGLYDEVPVCFEAADCSHDQALISVSDGVDTWQATVELPALCGCTRTRGYWQTHEEWPVDSLELGGVGYSQAECDAILESSTGGDNSLQLAAQLIAAKLNVAAGADDADIATVIEAADAWLVEHPPGSGARSWDGGEALKDALDAWNNGETGPGHCD
ncbi:VWA domain-containing protein [Myxococcota bacterium]|nr:VWA domain-containing protein [Myxococcota bacterium]